MSGLDRWTEAIGRGDDSDDLITVTIYRPGGPAQPLVAVWRGNGRESETAVPEAPRPEKVLFRNALPEVQVHVGNHEVSGDAAASTKKAGPSESRTGLLYGKLSSG
jgi:hypothetical protein